MPEAFKPTRKTPYADGRYPITELYLFPEYQTRAEYKAATGEEAPTYNPTLPVKNWRDPKALGRRTVLYKFLVEDKQGKLSIGDEETLGGAYAATVNMLPDNFTGLTPDEKANGGDKLKPPVRDLFPGEEFSYGSFGGPTLIDRSLAVNPSTPAPSVVGSFTDLDRKLLLSVRSEQVAAVERLTRIEDLLKGFTSPSL